MGVGRHMVALKKIKPSCITTPAERELLFLVGQQGLRLQFLQEEHLSSVHDTTKSMHNIVSRLKKRKKRRKERGKEGGRERRRKAAGVIRLALTEQLGPHVQP